MKIQRNPLPPPLRADDLKGGTGVVTVEKVLVAASNKNKMGFATVVVCPEFPGKGIYLNETSKEYAIEAFGSDDSDDWTGKKMCLAVVASEDPRAERDPNVPKISHRVWVAEPSEWPKILKAHKKN